MRVMASDTLNSGTRRTTFFVLTLFLLSSVPLVSNVSADMGIPEELQAQEISAIFDAVSETTTVTWRNIETNGGDTDLFEELWGATYNVYRSDSPITTENILTLSPWHSVVACEEIEFGGTDPWNTNPNKCRGSAENHPGHSATYQVGAGTDGIFYYAISTELGDGNTTTTLNVNASALFEPVIEITTPIRSPYNIMASFDADSSKTNIQWINYNSINPVLPEDGPDAFEIHVWRTDELIDRTNGQVLLISETPIATLSPTTTTYAADVPPMTNRDSYYSVTYLLPNWTPEGGPYEDTRFLSNNAMTVAVLEDNTPPDDVDSTEALFTPNENGTGVTSIVWDDILSEDNEQYRIYRHGEYFNTTNNPYVQLIGTVQEGVSEFQYNIPFNTYGDFVYCVVIVDQFGTSNPVIPQSACDIVDEDADQEWIKEPTNVNATFIGDGITRVTWTDQLGIEGERYHIWRAGMRVVGSQFVENQSLHWMGSVSDGIEQFDVQLADDTSGTNYFYFVTSEALYNCPGCNGTVMYTELIQNLDGPIVEDTSDPTIASILNIKMIGDLQVIDLEWRNSPSEEGESYYLYRHFDDPFVDSEFAVSNYTDEGWEYIEGPLLENSFTQIVRQIPVPDDTERDVWYAVIIEDSYGNINPLIFPGILSNAIKISEDTKVPEVTYAIHDESNVPVTGSSLIRGEYTLRVEVSEVLDEFPIVNITTEAGGSLIGGSEQAMVLLSQNNNDPDKGPQYFKTFSISADTTAGELRITLNMTDLSLNSINREISDYSIDAKAPVVSIFSPTSTSDGAMYLYGNIIKIVAGSTDDVEIASMEMRFVQNYGTSSAVTEPWREVTGLSVNEDGDWTFEMTYPSGNFQPGVHELSVKATDNAGNERIEKVQFTTDWCRHRDDGATICEYSNPVQSEPDTIYPELNVTDPPYMVAWVTAGVSFLAVIASLLVIASAMSGPKKKKKGDDDDDEGDDWMNEFIGTSSEPDMADITGGAPAATEEKAEADKTANIEDEEDPFAVNVFQPKRRKMKKSSDEDGDDDDDEDDDDDDDDDDDEAPKKSKRRVASRRKPIKRKKKS